MDEIKVEKLARLSGRVAWKVVGALERRGYDIRGKISAPISSEVAPFQWTVCQLAVYVLVMAACMSAS
jgi:hypothetical protein